MLKQQTIKDLRKLFPDGKLVVLIVLNGNGSSRIAHIYEAGGDQCYEGYEDELEEELTSPPKLKKSSILQGYTG